MMSEEIVEEKSKLDMIVEALSNAKAPVIVFFAMFCILSILLYVGALSPQDFKELVLADGIVSAILKLVKE
ncbi:MAG: hypothetical protein DRP00_05050 [Candidatus Aenigmatarchaeota archaeon]|nr:MAG: hypothetical protein DRP00_05050 [Candidatus Aenigmarchaeota archaeon]